MLTIRYGYIILYLDSNINFNCKNMSKGIKYFLKGIFITLALVIPATIIDSIFDLKFFAYMAFYFSGFINRKNFDKQMEEND